jgi:serine/threonine protein kinase
LNRLGISGPAQYYREIFVVLRGFEYLTIRKWIGNGQIGHTITNKKWLFEVAHSFCVSAHATFQMPDPVAMVLDYVPGSKLFGRLKEEGKLSESRARFHAAELVLAAEYLHSHGFLFHDLKPENILVDRNGHLKSTQFGLCSRGR